MDFNLSVDKGQRSKGLYSTAPHQSVNPLIAGPEWEDNKAPFVVRFYGSVCIRPACAVPKCRGFLSGAPQINGPHDLCIVLQAWPVMSCHLSGASLKGPKEKQGKVPHLPPTVPQKRRHESIICKCIHLKQDLVLPKHTFADQACMP